MGISFVAGQMLNSNLTRDSNLAFNTNTLYINYSGNSVGIGTATPGAKLEVAGNILVGNVTISNIGTVSATGNITGGNLVSGNLVISSNVIGTTDGSVVAFSGTNGIAIPYGNTAQRPSPAVTGTLRLNTGLDQLEIWDGTTWLAGSGGGSGNTTITDQQFNGDGANTVFALTQTASQSSILVSINGVGQLPGTAYTVSGNSLTFTQAPAVSDAIDVRFLSAALSHDMIYNTYGNAVVRAYDTPQIAMSINTANALVIGSNTVVDITGAASLKLPVYTVAQTANIATPVAGQVIYVSNGNSGSASLAVYDGTSWKRVALGATISAT
jgi:hypothetical protein